MSGNDHNQLWSAARSLALPVDGSDNEQLSSTRRSNDFSTWRRRSQTASSADSRPRTMTDRWLRSSRKWYARIEKAWYNFTPLQRAGILILDVFLITATVLFFVYNQRILAWLSPAAKRWRAMPAGWLILWFMTFFVAFPPLIGYSTCVTIGGFVFGMKGWFIIATANVAGSTCAFIVSRTVLKNFVSRLTEKKQFAALSLVLKHDGLKLLTMIRICPLPYSLSNGAISTIPTVTWQNFGIATALASPKLLLHVFVGSRLGDLAENGDKMDAKTKIVSYVSIAIGMVVGFVTGYLVYVRTKARARQLEAEEADAAVSGRRPASAGSGYSDDPDEEEAVDVLRRDDDISLHQAEYDDVERGGYRDEFTDDEDAIERDIFDDGDGGAESEEIKEERRKSER